MEKPNVIRPRPWFQIHGRGAQHLLPPVLSCARGHSTIRWHILLFAVLAAFAFLSPSWADEPGKENRLINGGFEQWATNEAPGNRNAFARYTNNLAPVWWSGLMNTISDAPITATFARDQAVKHGGNSSIRIRNDSLTDISRVVSPALDVSPGTSYTLSAWYKGEAITKDAAPPKVSGVMVSIGQGPSVKFWDAKTSSDVVPKVSDGTFDWRRIEIRFTTKPTTEKIIIDLQLRLATGTVWFDDLALTATDAADSGETAPATGESNREPGGFLDDFNGLSAQESGSAVLNPIGWHFAPFDPTGKGNTDWATGRNDKDSGFRGITLRNFGGTSTWTWASKQFDPMTLSKVGDSITVTMNFLVLADTIEPNRPFRINLSNTATNIRSNNAPPAAPLGYAIQHANLNVPAGMAYVKLNGASEWGGNTLHTTRQARAHGHGTRGHALKWTLTRTATGVRMSVAVDGDPYDSIIDTASPNTRFNTLSILSALACEFDNIGVTFTPAP